MFTERTWLTQPFHPFRSYFVAILELTDSFLPFRRKVCDDSSGSPNYPNCSVLSFGKNCFKLSTQYSYILEIK